MTDLYALIDFPSSDPARFKVRYIRPPEPLSVLETPPGLWVIFRTHDRERVVEAVDLIRPEALAEFTGRMAGQVMSP